MIEYTVKVTNQFKKDYKQAMKQNKKIRLCSKKIVHTNLGTNQTLKC